jgi:hypothetical protein
MSDDNDYLGLMQQMQAITIANEVSKKMVEELTEIMSKTISKTEIKNIREGNMCGPCGLLGADGWILTTCVDGHMSTRRICEECRYWWAAAAGHLCPDCTAALFDWAYKADFDPTWCTTWGLER